MLQTLAGENTYEIQRLVRESQQSFTKTHGMHGVETFDGETVQWENLETILFGVSLFAEAKCITISNLGRNKAVVEKLLAVFEKIPDSVDVIFVEHTPDKRTAWYKTLKKKTQFTECSVLQGAQLQAWVREKIAEANARISPAAVQKLLDYVGSDQLRLENEMAKLTAYSPEITIETVELLVERTAHDTVFELLRLIFTHNISAALKKIDQLQQAHEDPFQIINMIIWQVHALAIIAVAAGRSQAEIAKEYGINPFVVQKSKDLLRGIDEERVRKIVSSVATYDVRLKSESIDPWAVIRQLIVEI